MSNESHQHAVKLGYTVRENADGTYDVRANVDVIKPGFASRSAAWDWAEEQASRGTKADGIAYQNNR